MAALCGHHPLALRLGEQKRLKHQCAAENWVFKMVSDAQLNANIDSQSGHVILGVKNSELAPEAREFVA